jgi:hypothetical protein
MVRTLHLRDPGGTLIVIESLSVAALGGLAIDKGRSEIPKCVGTRIKTHVELAGRDRELNQGQPAEDQQAELNTVLTRAVELTVFELFPGEERLGAARAVVAHYKPGVSPQPSPQCLVVRGVGRRLREAPATHPGAS